MLSEIKKNYQNMFEAEQRVADYILEHPDKVVFMSMAELASVTNTSDATVMRMCRRINMSGYSQFKLYLASVVFSDNPAQESNISKEALVNPTNVVEYMDYLQKKLSPLSKNINMDDVDRFIDLIFRANTIFAFGWGNTFTVAEDLCHRFLRNGVHTFTSDNMEYMIRSIALAKKDDVLIAISHTGQAYYTQEAMKLAHQKNMPVVLITNTPDSACMKQADIAFCANLDDDVLGTWGNVSHVPELIIVDILLYFLQKKSKDPTAGNISETVMTRFKI